MRTRRRTYRGRVAIGDAARFESDGWVSLPGPGGAGGVHARLRHQDGRVVVTELYIHGGPITAQTLRSIPMGRIEAMANTPFAPMESHGNVDGVVLSGPLVFLNSIGPERDVSMTELRDRVPVNRSADRSQPRDPLQRPDGTDPDAFSRTVADAYNAAVRETSAPAKALADEAGVPRTTVHRWIREARQRGHLPPARKGRAG